MHLHWVSISAAKHVFSRFGNFNATSFKSAPPTCIIVAVALLALEVAFFLVDMVAAEVAIQRRARPTSVRERREPHVHEVVVGAQQGLLWLGHLEAVSGDATVTTYVVVTACPTAAEVRLVIRKVHGLATDVTIGTWAVDDENVAPVSVLPDHAHFVPLATLEWLLVFVIALSLQTCITLLVVDVSCWHAGRIDLDCSGLGVFTLFQMRSVRFRFSFFVLRFQDLLQLDDFVFGESRDLCESLDRELRFDKT